MEPGEHYYIIGVGSSADWEAGRGSLYYITDADGERALPVFTTPERAWEFVEENLETPEAYMQLLESIGAHAETHAAPLADNRYICMPVDSDGLVLAAERMDADYLVRDLRPGLEQEILRLSE
jgi:hypothetical protein